VNAPDLGSNPDPSFSARMSLPPHADSAMFAGRAAPRSEENDATGVRARAGVAGTEAERRRSLGVDKQVELGSVVGCTCQATYHCTQHGLLHRIGGFFGGDPFHVTVPFFWPLLPLVAYLQWKNAHFTD
jgi:hypothetical protein